MRESINEHVQAILNLPSSEERAAYLENNVSEDFREAVKKTLDTQQDRICIKHVRAIMQLRAREERAVYLEDDVPEELRDVVKRMVKTQFDRIRCRKNFKTLPDKLSHPDQLKNKKAQPGITGAKQPPPATWDKKKGHQSLSEARQILKGKRT